MLIIETLQKNVDLALLAYFAHAWSREVPWEVFLNEVLPHAVADEPRDAWRAMMFSLFSPLVARATSISEATQIINQKVSSGIFITYHPLQLCSPPQSHHVNRCQHS